MEKPKFEEEAPEKATDIIMSAEVKLLRNGEVLLSSTIDNDLIVAKLLIDATQGILKGMVKERTRTMQSIRLLNPLNGGYNMRG